jgi:hypothetical protein
VASTLAWLDHDERQRHAMLQVVEAFSERDTVDELGLGGVREQFARPHLGAGSSERSPVSREARLLCWSG